MNEQRNKEAIFFHNDLSGSSTSRRRSMRLKLVKTNYLYKVMAFFKIS